MTCSAISAADNTTTATTDASDTHSSVSVDSNTIQTNHDTSSTNDNSHSSDSESNSLTHSDTSTSSTQSITSNKDANSDTSKSIPKVTNTTQSSSSIDKSTNTQSTNTDSQSSSSNTQSSSNSNSQIDNIDNCTTTTQSSTSNVNNSNSNQVENNTKSVSTELVDEKTQLKTDVEVNGNEYTVHNYDELIEAVTTIKPLNTYEEYIINLDDSEGNIYYATQQITWGEADGSQTAHDLVIEGNGVTIEGLGVDTTSDAENRFFILHDGYSLTLKDMKITNFYSYGFAGAIYADGGTLIVDNTEFLENVAGAHGGAIYINGENAVFESIDSTFLENTALGTYTDYNGDIYGHGGAIYIETSDSVTITNSEFTYNTARLGGAIRIGGGVMTITGSKFTYNTAEWNGENYGFGGALYNFNSDSLTVTGSSFIGNEAIGEYDTIYGFGGAIYNNNTLGGITIEDSEFLENTATNYGGALYINQTGDVEIKNTEFYKNSVDENGGAIYNGDSTSLTIEDSKFYSNNAGTEEIEDNEGRGGAIYIDQTGPISIDNVEFLVNSATRSGGAIYNLESTSLTIKNSKFTQNVATVNGGAIHNSDTLTISETQFIQNEAANGGAIYDDGKEIDISGSDFISNTADYGGAIYLVVSDGSLTIAGSTFLQNIANSNGGAISTSGTSEIKSSQFTGNTATTAGGAVYNTGELTITDTSFSLNKATDETDGLGGAIANYEDGEITIKESSTFSNNEALNGGAISNTGGSISLSSARFTDNEATHGGAIVNYDGTITISGTRFLENSATSGGAIYNDGGTLKISDNSRFSENSATNGGVVYVVDGDDVEITDSTFSENSATNGAVIYIVDGLVKITSSTFKENSAEYGGVIYNSGSSTTIDSSEFTDNSANEDGGAIYNTGSLTINVESDDESVFSLNSANNGGAIYSSGTLTLSNSEFTENTATNFGGALYNTAFATLISNDFIDNQGLYNNTIYNTNSLTMTGNYIKMYDYYTDAYTDLEMYSPIIDTTLTDYENILYYIYNPSGVIESIEVVTVDDTTQKTYVTYKFNNEGVYKVDIIYKNSDNTIEFNVNVYRASTSITVSATDRLLPTDTVTITGELYGEGEPIINGEVTLFIDGNLVGSTNTNEKGEYTFELTTTTTGETNFQEGIVRVDLGYNTVVVVYNDENGVYETVSAITEFEVYKIVTNLEITKTSDSIVIELTDASEDPLSGEVVEITITKDDESFYSESLTRADGKITIPISDYEEGAYIIEAKYEGSETYYDSQDIKAFIIRDGAYLTVEVDKSTVKVGETVIATVTIEGIEDIDPNSLEITINGNKISSDQITTISEGVFEVTYEPTRDGEYIIIATYTDPNGDHDTISDYAVFDAEKIVTITVVSGITAAEGSNVDLTAYVFDYDNLQYVNEGEVLFIINNEIVRDSNGNILYAQVHNGVATLPYTITEDVGSYGLIAIYTGTDKYFESYSETNAKLTVGQPETELIPTTTIVNSVAGVQGDTVDLTATVYDNEGNLVDRGQVYFMIDGRIVIGTDGNIFEDIEDGVAKLPYLLTSDVGEYTITAVYIANDKYLESNSINEGLLVVETQLSGDMIPTITIVDSIKATQGETVNLTANVYDENGRIVTEGQVSFEIDGVTITDSNGNILYAEVVNGVARLPYTVTNDPNDYTIKASYQGTDTYYPSDSLNDAKLSVVARPDSDKIPTTTIVDDMTVVSGSTVNLTATVYDENGYLVTDGRVSFRLNGVTIKDEDGNILYADVVNGIAKLPYTVINSPKNYTLEAIYTGNDLYLPSNSTTYANATLQVLDGRIPTSTIVDSVTGTQGETVNLTATVYDEYGDLVTEGEVLFKLNNVTVKDEEGNILYAEVVDGVAKLPYTITNSPKDYNISAVYMGTDTYLSSKSVNNATLTVEDTSKYKIPTITIVDSIIANKGDTVNLTATVFDNDGNLVCEGDVSFKLNGVTLKDEFGNVLYAQIEDGVARMPYTITNSPKNYTITAVYQGTDTYLSSKSVNNGTLMVLAAEDKVDTTTTADGVTATPNETVNLTAEVTDENGDPVTEGEVYFEIDGEPITDEDGNIIYVPVIDGVARLPYTPEKEGNFTITAKYNGTDKYAPSDAENSGTTGNLIVVDENSNVTTTITVTNTSQQYGDYVNFTATIVDEYGNKVTGGKVVFKLNGVTIKDEEGNIVYAQVVDGLASISYLVTNNVKDYQLSAVYSGSGIFDSSRSTNVTFTVTPRSVNITVDKLDDNIKSGDNVTFKATITESDTTYTDNGVVVFKINGKTIRDEEGNPIIVDVNDGVATLDYQIPVDFAGKDYNITAVYTNDNYLRAEANNTLTTVRSNVQTELNTITVSKGQDANIYMVLYDENGNQLERDTKVAIKINGHTIIHMNTTEGVLNATIPASVITDTTNRIDIVLGENQGYYELRLNTTLTVKS